MMMFLLLPLADLAVAGFQFVSAWQALRSFGQYAQYLRHDVTDLSGRNSKLPTTVAGYPISNLQVVAAMQILTAPRATLIRPKSY